MIRIIMKKTIFSKQLKCVKSTWNGNILELGQISYEYVLVDASLFILTASRLGDITRLMIV